VSIRPSSCEGYATSVVGAREQLHGLAKTAPDDCPYQLYIAQAVVKQDEVLLLALHPGPYNSQPRR